MKGIAQKSNDTLYFQLVEQASFYENYGRIKLRFERLFFSATYCERGLLLSRGRQDEFINENKKKAKVSQALSI